MSRRSSATPPHILIIVQNLPVPLDRRVWLEAQTLSEAGYEVTIISPRGEGDMAISTGSDHVAMGAQAGLGRR